MKIQRSFAVLLIAGSALWCASDARAGSLKELEMGSSQEILGGRLKVRLPKESKIDEPAARGYPVLQSRITISAGGDECYILVQELLQLAPNNYEETVRKLAGDTEGKVERLETSSEDLRVYAIWPAEITTRAEANLLLTLFVARRDRSVQLLTFFINGTAAGDPGGSRVMGKRIARSLAAGPTELKRVGGRTTLRSPGGDSLAITLPKNSIVTRDGVTGSSVQYSIFKMVTLGAPHSGSLGVQIGGHPEHRYKKFTAEPIKRSGKLAGEPTEWFSWQITLASGQLASVIEATAEPRVADGIVPIHVYVTADNSTDLASWQKVASSVEVVR